MTPMLDYRWHYAILAREDTLNRVRRPEIRARRPRWRPLTWLPRRWRPATEV